MVLRLVFVALLIVCASAHGAAILHVGPAQTYSTPCAAIAAASAGDTIQIDASGNYDGDVCGWSKNGLTLIGVNGRPHINAAGNNSQGKAIWVISGNDTVIDNIEMSDCHVVDLNGAGIRQEGKNLTVLHSYFHDNDEGILAGDVAGSTVTIEHTEFYNNGAGDGYSHNLYINHVDKLVFRYNWSHHASVGHLLKTRALQNVIAYNRLTGEAGGSDSYEINIPNGGLSYVIGNLIEKSITSENPAMLDYLSEGSPNPDSHLFVINNTFVNDTHQGAFMQISATDKTAIIARNNVFFGGGTICTQTVPAPVLDHNYSGNAPKFFDVANYDYRPLPGSPLIDAGVDPGLGVGQPLTPVSEYWNPTNVSPRAAGIAIDIGAYDYEQIFGNDFDP
jgi:hypothetical protein